MDSEKKKSAKRRSLEAGREMLARYKESLRNIDTSQTGEPSDESFVLNDTQQSVDPQSLLMLEDTSCKDTTQSSISMSEGEGDGDIDGMAGRVAELKELMQGKEAMIESLSTEIENMRAEAGSPNSSQSQNSSTQYKDLFNAYKSKVFEFEQAIKERDDYINHLTVLLEQTLASRDSLKTQLAALKPISVPRSDTDGQLDVDKKIQDLEEALGNHVEVIQKLNEQLLDSCKQIDQLEVDKKSQDAEIVSYKFTINKLNEDLQKYSEMMNMYEETKNTITKRTESVIEKFKAELDDQKQLHEQQIKELNANHQAEVAKIKQRYEEQYKGLFERFNSELPALESKHSKELHVFQTQLTTYKKIMNNLKTDLDNRIKSEQLVMSDLNNSKRQLMLCQQDKEMLEEQIKLHKVQVEELTVKYMAASSVLNSKESIERSLEEALINVETLKRDYETLQSKYDDVSAKYAATQSLIENTQSHERAMNHRGFEYDKSLSRMSGLNASFASEINATTYQTFDDFSIQYEMMKKRLEEKDSLEKKLIDKISGLEDKISKITKQLEETNLEKESYEKQFKDAKNRCDKMMSELKTMKESNATVPQPFPSSIYFPDNNSTSLNDSLSEQKDIRNDSNKIESFNREIEELKQALQQKDQELTEADTKLRKAMEKIKQYKAECDQAKSGLARAWEHCAEVGERLNQTLAINESRFTDSIMTTFSNNNNTTTNDLIDQLEESSDKIAISSCKYEDESIISTSDKISSLSHLGKQLNCLHVRTENIELENQKLKEENTELLKVRDNWEKIKADMEKRHAQEMEEVRTYFEDKCVQIEKQYSEDVFSQQSKKMSDDSEVEEMADDLYCGGGGDCIVSINNKTVDNSKTQVTADRHIKCEDLNRNSILETKVHQLCQTELDAAVESSELTELRAAYSQQLAEQIALAKCDIVNALQEQIQALVSAESSSEENWPPELLELRNKFTNNAKRDIEKLKEDHLREINQLKEEHSRNLSKTIERYQEEVNKLSSEIKACNQNKHVSLVNNDDKFIQRDNLYKTCATLKSSVEELIKYFANCEEELNNILMTQVLKRQISNINNLTNDETDLYKSEADINLTSSTSLSPTMKIKRVHFAPLPSQISTIMKNDSNILIDLIEADNDIAGKLRIELQKCLQRLKTESAEIFDVNLSSDDSVIDALSKQISWTTKINEELNARLSEAENTIEEYQDESQQLKCKIMDLQQKLIAIDTRKEIISEGYGEQDNTERELVVQDFNQLHERARQAIMNGAGDNSYLLQLIEELCRYHDKQSEDNRKEKEDLQQQIEAADKQLRSTRKFLEEQASEREIERDDAARQIQALQEHLKEREREKERDLRISSEPASLSPEPSLVIPTLQNFDGQDVEGLEQQIREMSQTIQDLESKKTAVDDELKAAVDKIWELRDIIVSLETQLESKTELEKHLLNQIEQNKEIISSQNQHNQELAQELETLKLGGDNTQDDHIIHLQEELRKHKLSTEHFNVNSTALRQMKSELQDMQNHLDKKTKELETLHMCGSNLSISQPSEDVSIRDQIDATRCPTPDDPNAPPTLPLDQLLKLKDKLLKHTRAEEVALKRIKDLDMQLSTLKIQNEELQAEQEILQQTNSEQLFQIEAMRGRLEQYKQSAPFAQRQATSRLELQLHEVNTKVHSMEQELANKDRELLDVKYQLERKSQLLQDKQDELFTVVQTENDIINELKNRVEHLEQEKRVLETKCSSQERAQQELPQLIESMLTDKNEEIDHLKEQLSKKEKQFEVYTSLQMEEGNLQHGKNEPKNSARTLSDILSIHSECEEISEAIREGSNVLHNTALNISSAKVPGSFVTNDQLDGSSVPFMDLQKSDLRNPPLELSSQPYSFTSSQHVSQPQLSAIESVHSEGEFNSPKRNSSVVSDGAGGSTSKNKQSGSLSKTDIITPTRTKSVLVGSNLSQPCIEDLENQLKAIHNELQAKSATLSKRELELDALQKSLDELRAEFKDSIDTVTRDKVFYKNQYELSQESEKKIRNDLEEVENILKIRNEELEIYRDKLQTNEQVLHELQNENDTLRKDIRKICDDNMAYQTTIREKVQELKNLKDIIFEKDITIETIKTRNVEIENENKQLYTFKTKFESCRKDLMDKQSDIKRLTDGLNSRDELIQRLEEMARRRSLSNTYPMTDKDQEIHHLQEYIKEKDKVIKQMTDDSKSLQRSLETIQSKIKESGNVIELRKKLKEERMFNDELTKMVAKLKQELEILKDESVRQSSEGADIEDMVQRELNLSADLDRKILDAIENESEELTMGRRVDHACNSIKPFEQDIEKIMQQYSDIRRKLKQANKLNEQLLHEKNELEIEQDILKSQIMDYENRILEIKSDLDDENKKNMTLVEDLSVHKIMIRDLQIHVQKEKNKSRRTQMEDADIIKELRLRLTTSLDVEKELRDSLATARQNYKLLQVKLNNLKETIEPERSGNISSSPELQEAEKNDLMMAEKYEKVVRELIELQDTLKINQAEKNRYEKQLEIELEERERLLSQIALVESSKEHLEIELKRTKEELKSYQDESKWLKKRLDSILEADEKKQSQRSDEQNELKNLRHELKNTKEVMRDLEIDSKELKRQLERAQIEQDQVTHVLANLRKSESVLQKKLNAAKNDEERLKEVIEELRAELQARFNRELELSKGFLQENSAGDKNMSAKLINQITELTSENARYSLEKGVLHDKLIKAREEIERHVVRVKELELMLQHSDGVTSSHDNNQLLMKLQYIYAKYMRVDSKRKALAFQKRYLLCVIGGYQLSEDNARSMLAKLTSVERSFISEQTLHVVKTCPRARFRSAVLLVIGLRRMKWMVQRWRSGKRKPAPTMLTQSDQTYPHLRVHLANHLSSNNNDNPRHSSTTATSTSANPDNGNPLGGIDYEYYAQRFHNIENILGLAMNEADSHNPVTN
ncbi:centromere-associated protein E-like isoform X3 [Cotesia glomerata]|uniref:centromere-associated protein E-like isoform X3 n=1 Tax=Cotesia glomerata TaxID=32391 RepID=UPI001D020602|nr:centromere-associated protein E-like isoform X3 [Cotesia glomerata]